MKIERLIGIVTHLLQIDKTTAPELARRFKISQRTIFRNVETLCKAGIPIVTTQGGNGGISIMEGYRLDKSLLTQGELQNILTGLQSIQSISKSSDIQKLLEKLLPKSRDILPLNNTILIDLSSFYKDSLSEKIDLLKCAIAEKRLVSFHFYKLKRLWALSVLDAFFSPREIKEEKKQLGGHITDDYFVTVVYAPSEKYKLIEEYGWSSTVFCITERFFGNEVFEMAAKISKKEAEELITEQIYKLNPAAESKLILKFMRG